MPKSLGDYIVDRTESLDDDFIKDYFVEHHSDKVVRLLDSEYYLLEGSRGVGKTMLMKTAAIQAREQFAKDCVLAVWISFEESIRIERIRITDKGIDPFLQWTMGKILYEVLKELATLKPSCIDILNERLSKIFKIENKYKNMFDRYQNILTDYIQLLEKGDIDNTSLLSKGVPSTELSSILDNPTSFKHFLLGLINDFQLERMILLFDEAAHVFSYSQQEKFFTFFKSLRDPKIACKAAVYPGITNFGKYFEKGQDAKELRIDWTPTNREDLDYIKEILRKRIQAFDLIYWNKLTVNPVILDTIAICSNGNPRFAFHIIDALDNARVFRERVININSVINSLRSVFDSKWKEFNTLKQRLVRYEKPIIEAEQVVKSIFIPNLRSWNDKQRRTGNRLSIGFYISTDVYDKVPQVFDVLAYANIIGIDYSKKSLGHKQYGYFVALNPSLLFSDLIIKDSSEIRLTSTKIKTNQAYYVSTPEIRTIIETAAIENEYKCSDSKCSFVTNNEIFKFCPICTASLILSEPESLYKILRSHSVDNLKLSQAITARLKDKFANIGEIYDADIDEIKMKYIQDVRAEKVKYAAIEYMAG